MAGNEAKISKVIHSDTFQVVDHAQAQGEPSPLEASLED